MILLYTRRAKTIITVLTLIIAVQIVYIISVTDFGQYGGHRLMNN